MTVTNNLDHPVVVGSMEELLGSEDSKPGGHSSYLPTSKYNRILVSGRFSGLAIKLRTCGI